MSCVPRRAGLLLGLCLAGLLWWCDAPRGAPSREPPHLTLRTDLLLPAVVLADSLGEQGITALTLDLTFDDADAGRGFLTVEEGSPTLNPFGDVLAGPPLTLPAQAVTVQPLLDDPGRPRRLYALTRTDGRFPHQLMLVRGLTPAEPHLLLIRHRHAPPPVLAWDSLGHPKEGFV